MRKVIYESLKDLFFIILLTLMVSYPALSKVVLLPLNEMVSNAELIVIGKEPQRVWNRTNSDNRD